VAALPAPPTRRLATLRALLAPAAPAPAPAAHDLAGAFGCIAAAAAAAPAAPAPAVPPGLGAPGALVLVDFSSSLLDAPDVDALAAVLVSCFRALPPAALPAGAARLLLVEDAHTLLAAPGGPAAAAVAAAAAAVRAEDLRVAVASAAPAELPPSLLDAASLVLVQRTQSADACAALRAKLPLPGDPRVIEGLATGAAVAVANAPRSVNVLELRDRLTGGAAAGR
jgi:hypothetical protein